MLRPLVAGTAVAFILAPVASWSKDPPQQTEVEQTGHILQPKPLDPNSAEIGKLKLICRRPDQPAHPRRGRRRRAARWAM
jgi:hypothetical protein